MEDKVLIGIGAFLYLGGFLFALGYLWRAQRYERWILYPLLLVGFLIQTFGLYQRGMETGGCPLGNLFEIFQFIAWSIVLIYLVVGPVFRLSILGFFSAGLAALIAVVSWAIPAWDGPVRENIFSNPWIELHAATAIFSYGVLGILAATSLMFLIENHGLRQHRSEGVFRFLPSIRELEIVNRRFLLLATAFLTFSLLLGSIYWLPNLDSVNWTKLLFTLLLWVCCGMIWGLHHWRRLSSVRFAKACVLLFGFSLLTLVPVDYSRNPSELPARGETDLNEGGRP